MLYTLVPDVFSLCGTLLHKFTIQPISLRKANCAIPVLLLQKVMVSPGTPLEKNYESQSRIIASQLKNNNESLGLYVTTKLIWRQTPKLCITVYWNRNILLLLSSTTKVKEICTVKQQPQEQPQKSHTQDIHQKLLQIDQSIFASFRTHTTNCFVSLRTLMHQGRR